MRKWFFLLLIGGMLASLLLCPEGQAAQKSPYEGITLRIANPKLHAAKNYETVFKKAAAELGMNVEVANFTMDGEVEKILLDTAAGVRTWDIFYVHTPQRGVFVAAGSAIPLNEYIEDPKLTSSEVRKYIQEGRFANEGALISDGVWGPKGKRWSVGLAVSSANALWYRKDLFNHPLEKKAFGEKYGYKLEPPRNYRQLRDIAEFFTRKKGEMLAGKKLETDFWGLTQSWKPGGFAMSDYGTYAANMGYEQIEFDPETWWPNWDSPLNKATARYLKSLMPYQTSGTLGFTSGASFSLFCEGTVAMTMEYLGRGTEMAFDPEKSKIIDKVDAMLPPKAGGLAGTPRSLGSGDAYWIYSLSRHKEAAYKLLEKVNTYKYQKMVMELGTIPLLTDVWKDPELLGDPLIKRKLEVYSLIKGMDVFMEPPTKISARITTICGGAINEALAGTKTVDEAYDEAQKKLVELFRKKGYIE